MYFHRHSEPLFGELERHAREKTSALKADALGRTVTVSRGLRELVEGEGGGDPDVLESNVKEWPLSLRHLVEGEEANRPLSSRNRAPKVRLVSDGDF